MISSGEDVDEAVITILKFFEVETTAEFALATTIVKWNVPAEVATPLMVPSPESLRPVGTAPPTIFQV